MPLFEYFCDTCQKKVEKLKPTAESETELCPECQKPMRKLMSVVNHTFGFVLSDRSHERFGPRDEFVRNV